MTVVSNVLNPSTAVPRAFEFKGVVRLTKIGTTYIVGTVVLAIAAVNTGNNALYLAVALMLGCLLLSGVASKTGLRHIDIVIRGIDEAWAGKPARGILVLTNHSRIWNVRDVVLTAEAFAEPVLIPLLPRQEQVEVAASFLFPRRGHAQIGRIDSYTRYPFGFFLKKRRVAVSSNVVVYPRLLADESARERFRPVTGEDAAANRPGTGADIHSFREYVRGDELRYVHWKKVASLGRWIIKQHEEDSGRSVHVVVDPYRPRGMSDEEFEEMISAAATFIHDAVERRLDVTLSLPRVTIRARQEEPAAPLFRALALVEPIYERVHQAVPRSAVLFAHGRRETLDDSQSA